MSDDCFGCQGRDDARLGAASVLLDSLANQRRLTTLWHLAQRSLIRQQFELGRRVVRKT